MTKTKPRKIEVENFFNDRNRQREYSSRVNEMIHALEIQWPDSYKPPLHDEIVKELVRSEMMSRYYEQRLANGEETELTPALLGQERANVHYCRSKLIIGLRDVRKEEGPIGEEAPPSIFSLAQQAYNDDQWLGRQSDEAEKAQKTREEGKDDDSVLPQGGDGGD